MLGLEIKADNIKEIGIAKSDRRGTGEQSPREEESRVAILCDLYS